MTGTELQKLLDDSCMSARGTARRLAINERTMRSYLAGDLKIPRTVELAVLYLVEHREDRASPAGRSTAPRSRPAR